MGHGEADSLLRVATAPLYGLVPYLCEAFLCLGRFWGEECEEIGGWNDCNVITYSIYVMHLCVEIDMLRYTYIYLVLYIL